MATTANEKQEIKEAVEITAKAISAGKSVREMIKNERNNWFDRHRGAVVESNNIFYHPIIERIYQRDFNKMSEYLYFIPVFGRVLLDKEEDVIKVESHVKNSIVKHTAAIDRRIKEASIVYNQHGVDMPVSFTNGSSFDVKITSPLSRMYLELLLQGDKFLMLMNDLWIRGLLHEGDYEMNERKRSDYELEIKRMINTVNVTILRQQRAILNRLRRQNESAKGEAKSEAKSEAKTETIAAAKPAANEAKAPAEKPKRAAKPQASKSDQAAEASAQAEQSVTA